MEREVVLAIDLGTTGNRVIAFDRGLNIAAKKYREFPQYFPKSGWVEHDPMDILACVHKLLKEIMDDAKIKLHVAAIGITNQRETTVLWDRKTGKPIYNAIVWQDRRTAEICDKLKNRGYEKLIRQKTGLLLDAYFSATKIQWLLDHVPGARKKAINGDILFGTVDTWILWNLTKGKIHATDFSNASRTMLFNIKSLKWDDALLKLFNVPKNILPEVKSSSGLFGYTDKTFLGKAIPITGVAGDQQAALFGQACFNPGDMKITYGTGCFLNMNTGKKPVCSKNKLLTTIAWGIGKHVDYALEGSVFMGGASVQWLRDGLKIIKKTSETEEIARRVKDNGGVYFVPALVGLGAPHWDMQARGIIIGITRGTTREHVVRATLEAIAYQVKDITEAMKADTRLRIDSLKTDGGACANNFLMQFQSDILKTALERPLIIETTALGAAGLAGLAAGFWKDKNEFRYRRKIDRIFKPKMNDNIRKTYYLLWKRAVSRAKGWITNNQ